MVDAAVGGMGARRAGHGLGDDPVDASGGLEAIGPQRFGEPSDRSFGRRLVQRHVAAQEVVPVEQAQHQVGVRHRGIGTATAVAGRAGFRAGAARADLEQAQAVHRRDAAAARADLDHVDGGDGERHAAPLAEPVHPVDLEASRHQRLEVLDQARLGRGAAHVERQEPGQLQPLGVVGRGQRARGRPALDHAHGVARGDLRADHAAAAQHDQRPVGRAGLFQAGGEAPEIGGGDGGGVGVDRRRRRPRVLADLRRHGA